MGNYAEVFALYLLHFCILIRTHMLSSSQLYITYQSFRQICKSFIEISFETGLKDMLSQSCVFKYAKHLKTL